MRMGGFRPSWCQNKREVTPVRIVQESTTHVYTLRNRRSSVYAFATFAALFTICRVPLVDAATRLSGGIDIPPKPSTYVTRVWTDSVEEREQQIRAATRNASSTTSTRTTSTQTQRVPERSAKATLEYELGKEHGLKPGSEVPVSVVQAIVQGADKGNRGRVVDANLRVSSNNGRFDGRSSGQENEQHLHPKS